MIVFKDKRTGKIANVFSAETYDNKVAVRFEENGRIYYYNKENVELIDNSDPSAKEADIPFLVYKLDKECYKCHKITEVYTYVIFKDKTRENVTYPWDKKRLLKGQNLMAHMMDESIEYYGLSVIGDDAEYDAKMMELFPDKIQVKYSSTQDREYPMNICSYCGSGQGWNYIYRLVNKKIKANERIKLLSDD